MSDQGRYVMHAAGDDQNPHNIFDARNDADAPAPDDDDGWGPTYTAKTVAVLKGIVENAPRSQQLGSSSQEVLSQRGVIEPPLPFESLVLVKELSSTVPQAVEAMAQNVDGFGHRIKSLINFDSADADKKVRAILRRERKKWKRGLGHLMEEGDRPEFPFGVPFDPEADEDGIPSDDDVAKAKAVMRELAEDEKDRIDAFFKFSSCDRSFIDLRMDLRRDTEVLANDGTEVLRDREGKIAGLEYVPFATCRLTKEDVHYTDFTERVLVSAHRVVTVTRSKRFRRIAQLGPQGEVVFFKEFRDPRLISRTTGEVLHPDHHDPRDLANEFIHRKLPSHGLSPYGMIRWSGVLLEVLGTRQAGEVNHSHFENKTLPIGILAVEGGFPGKGTQQRVTDFIGNHVKGKKNYHRLMVFETTLEDGEVPPGAAPRLKFIDLSGAAQKDALFQKYIERNDRVIRSAWRLPKLFFGETKDFNRATAQVAMELAEQQVFTPERNGFDTMVNRLLFPEMGVLWHVFESKGLPLGDPKATMEMVTAAVKGQVVTPGDVREKVADALDIELAPLTDTVGKLPTEVLKALTAVSTPEQILALGGIESQDPDASDLGPDEMEERLAMGPEEEDDDPEAQAKGDGPDAQATRIELATAELKGTREALEAATAALGDEQ